MISSLLESERQILSGKDWEGLLNTSTHVKQISWWKYRFLQGIHCPITCMTASHSQSKPEHQHLIKKQAEHQDPLRYRLSSSLSWRNRMSTSISLRNRMSTRTSLRNRLSSRGLVDQSHSISLRNRLLAQSVTYLRWRILLHLFSSLFDEVGYWWRKGRFTNINCSI